MSPKLDRILVNWISESANLTVRSMVERQAVVWGNSACPLVGVERAGKPGAYGPAMERTNLAPLYPDHWSAPLAEPIAEFARPVT